MSSLQYNRESVFGYCFPERRILYKPALLRLPRYLSHIPNPLSPG